MTDPRLDVDDASLREADRQLAFLEDVHREDDTEVPAWLIAARRVVREARGEADDG